MKNNKHFRSYLTQFFLEWEIFQIKENIRVRQATGDNMKHAHFMLAK